LISETFIVSIRFQGFNRTAVSCFTDLFGNAGEAASWTESSYEVFWTVTPVAATLECFRLSQLK